MKLEFIPRNFKEPNGECTICDTRKALEAALSEESDSLQAFGRALFASTRCQPDQLDQLRLVDLYLQLSPSFGDALADYRVCFSENLALYFSVERQGRLRKVPEFVGACDEYRERALASRAEFDALFENFTVSVRSFQGTEQLKQALEQLISKHEGTQTSSRAFWTQMDLWYKERKQAAQKLFGSAGE